MFKQILAVALLLIVIIGSLFTLANVLGFLQNKDVVISPMSMTKKQEKQFEKYAIANLKDLKIPRSSIRLGEEMDAVPPASARMFYFNSFGKKVSGRITYPSKKGEYPLIIMFRGHVDREIYDTGVGTQHGADVYARNGYVTLAPDFLGYGQSDMASKDSLEERFETYTTALSLLSSVNTLNKALEEEGVRVDTSKIGIWGHSNGGHIALVVLEALEQDFPTTLWAPVSKPFPYSILYYTDMFEDHGKYLRRIVSEFEEEYDAEKYSPTNYFGDIKAPINLHQGTADELVPKKWSDELYDQLDKLGIEVTYYTYPGDDHNFAKGSWNTVMNRDLQFFRRKFSQSL